MKKAREGSILSHPKLLRIGFIPEPTELDLRIMFLTGLALSVEGEEDRDAILVEASQICCEELSEPSEQAANSTLYKALH